MLTDWRIVVVFLLPRPCGLSLYGAKHIKFMYPLPTILPITLFYHRIIWASSLLASFYWAHIHLPSSRNALIGEQPTCFPIITYGTDYNFTLTILIRISTYYRRLFLLLSRARSNRANEVVTGLYDNL